MLKLRSFHFSVLKIFGEKDSVCLADFAGDFGQANEFKYLIMLKKD